MENAHRKSGIAMVSVLSNSVLVSLKLVVGVAIGSVAVISEAIHSGLDLVAALIAWFAVRTAEKPADDQHPFGHGKFENLSGTIEALLIFIAAIWILVEAVQKLVRPQPMSVVGWGVAVMGLSAVVNTWVSRALFRVGKATDSIALQADAWHLRTDVWTSLGVMAGLGLIVVLRWLWPGIACEWIDPAAAIGVALLIVRAAYQLTIRSGADLLDARLSPAEERFIRETIISHGPPVCGFHRLRTRKSGSQRFVEFHLLVDPEMTVQDSHDLTNGISRAIEQKFPPASVTIHIEPCDGSCAPVCLEGCLLTEPQRAAARKRNP